MKAKSTLLIIMSFLTSMTVYAQEATQSAAKVKANINFMTIFANSDIFGYMILIVIVIGLTMAISKFIQLYVKEKIDAGQFYLKLKGYIKNEQFEEAAKIAESFKNTTLGFIFWSGLRVFIDAKKSGKSGSDLRDTVQNAFDEAVLQTVYKIDSGLFWYDTLAQICTYIGLLGTIIGLIQSFQGLAASGAGGSEANAMLTEGIQKAISATAMGLSGAIPLTLIKGGLLTKAQKVINDIDEFDVKMINQINNAIKD